MTMLDKAFGVIRRHKLAATAALAAPLIVFTATGASAAPDGQATIVGSGTISPALTTSPSSTFSTVTFTGTAVQYAGAVGTTSFKGANASCHFNGTSDILEDIQTGDGNGTAGCSGGTGDALNLASPSNGVHYSRTGGAVTISGSVSGTVGSTAVNCSLSGQFNFVATSNPVGTYQLQGQVEFTCSPPPPEGFTNRHPGVRQRFAGRHPLLVAEGHGPP
jgi:hypothetical protein